MFWNDTNTINLKKIYFNLFNWKPFYTTLDIPYDGVSSQFFFNALSDSARQYAFHFPYHLSLSIGTIAETLPLPPPPSHTTPDFRRSKSNNTKHSAIDATDFYFGRVLSSHINAYSIRLSRYTHSEDSLSTHTRGALHHFDILMWKMCTALDRPSTCVISVLFFGGVRPALQVCNRCTI